MSWTDKTALETIRMLRDDFHVSTFIETGTFKGINALVQSDNFSNVITVEKNWDFYVQALEKLEYKRNVDTVMNDSPEFLRIFREEMKKRILSREKFIIYLDAHFYDPAAKNKFVVTEELEALEGFEDCIIIIHDFDNGMGHIVYDGIPLNMDLLRDRLLKVNPKFKFYTNIPEKTEIHTKESLKEIGLQNDKDAIDNIEYAWSDPRLTKRGILYAVPNNLDLNRYPLREWN